MTQLRRDAAYILPRAHERTGEAPATPLTPFDQQVCDLFATAHTVTSAAKTLSQSAATIDMEDRVANAMQRLLQAERIQLSPDS